MKILTIVYDLERGGTQRAAQNYSIAFKELGHDIAVLPLYTLGERATALRDNAIGIFAPFKSDDFDLEELFFWKPDIIHIHRSGEYDAVITDLLKKIKELLPNTFIVETNVFSHFDHRESTGLIDLHTHLSRWCFWKWSISIPFFYKKGLATVLPYLVLPDNFYKNKKEKIERFKRENKIPEGKFVFGRIAQKSDAKWSMIDIKAFLSLSKKYNDLHLALVGISPRAESFLMTLTSDQRDRITIIDYIVGDESLNLAYNAFDVFIHAARIGESFGMVFAESLLCETPVVALSTPTRDNSQHELISKTSGFVVGNQMRMEEKMLELYLRPEMIAKMGKSGRQHILDNYTPDVLAPRAINIFEILINQKKDNWRESLAKANFPVGVTTLEAKSLYGELIKESSLKTKLFFFFPKTFFYIREKLVGLMFFLKMR